MGGSNHLIYIPKIFKKIKIIDQTKLPFKFKIKELSSLASFVNAIKTMEVRGAPLIGVTAAFGLAFEIVRNADNHNIEKAAEKGGLSVEVPFTPGRMDASQDQTDVDSFNVMEQSLNKSLHVLTRSITSFDALTFHSIL